MRLRRARRPHRAFSSLGVDDGIVWLEICSGGTATPLSGSDVVEVVMSMMFRSGPKKWLLVKKDLSRDEVLPLATESASSHNDFKEYGCW
jgi:hypothetical protein